MEEEQIHKKNNLNRASLSQQFFLRKETDISIHKSDNEKLDQILQSKDKLKVEDLDDQELKKK